MPLAFKEAVRVTIRAAIQDGKGVQVQYSPAYDFGLRLWDYGQAISVHLQGPYTEPTIAHATLAVTRCANWGRRPLGPAAARATPKSQHDVPPDGRSPPSATSPLTGFSAEPHHRNPLQP